MFGFGKKKEQGPPQNADLGRLLDAMMRNPEKNQDAFYEAFLTSNVFLIGETGNATEGEQFLQGGESVKIMQWMDPSGHPFIPVFTSKEELERSTQGETVNFVSFNGYDAMNLTQGQLPLAIDPSNDHCLYLVPPQIEQILNYWDEIKS